MVVGMAAVTLAEEMVAVTTAEEMVEETSVEEMGVEVISVVVIRVVVTSRVARCLKVPFLHMYIDSVDPGWYNSR
jgi:hypothetical protein